MNKTKTKSSPSTSFNDYLEGKMKDSKFKRLFEESRQKTLLEIKLHKQLKSLRKQRGLTQKQIAKIMGTTHSAISRLEREDYISSLTLDTLIRYVHALNGKLEIRVLT